MERRIKTVFVFCALLMAGIGAAQDRYEIERDISYRKGESDVYAQERCVLDIYYPKDSVDFPTIVWFHGGGLRAGEKFIPDQLKNKGVAVIAVNYRLFPKVKSPVYVEDAAAAVAWTFENIENYGGAKDRIFVSGHSAGGYLTTMIGLDKKYLQAFDQDADNIAGLIPYSGHTITHFTVREEMGLEWNDVLVDEMAPLSLIRKDAPPIILVTGDRNMELFGRYEEVAYFWRMLKLVGHPRAELYELQGYDHGAMAEPAHHITLNSIKSILQD